MKNLLLLLLFCVIIIDTCAQKKILIYTRNGKGYVHENRAASVAALEKLCKENGYTTYATEDASVFTPENLKTYQCVIFSNTNNETFETQEQRDAFMNYIRNGGGFVGIHSASGSERQWPWFWAMLGGKFVRHPKFQKFNIKVIDKAHSATNFLGDNWEWEDECYYLDNLNPDIHVLIAADLTTVEDTEKEKYPGNIFGNYFPLAWCHEFDGGRQFYTALGHESRHYEDKLFLQHLLGGIKWAMKEK